jgi:predicted nucleic acid-binding protein
MATPERDRGLIDTDVLIDHTRGVADASSFLTARHAAGGVYISVVTAIEVVQGCRDATPNSGLCVDCAAR